MSTAPNRDSAEAHDFLKQYRRRPLLAPDGLKHRVAYGVEDIKRVVPHREPFLLIDAIHGIDVDERAIVGSRHIPASDPVFQGHFPGFPVYPGTLLLEMMGQMGTALLYFLERGDCRIAPDAKPLNVRATKVLGAIFLEPVRPDSHVTLAGKCVLWDGLCARFAGQALVEGVIACVAVAELYVL